MVLGYSRLIWARFVIHQDLGDSLALPRRRIRSARRAPRDILYDRMKTAVLGEDADGLVP